MIMSSAMPA